MLYFRHLGESADPKQLENSRNGFKKLKGIAGQAIADRFHDRPVIRMASKTEGHRWPSYR